MVSSVQQFQERADPRGERIERPERRLLRKGLGNRFADHGLSVFRERMIEIAGEESVEQNVRGSRELFRKLQDEPGKELLRTNGDGSGNRRGGRQIG